MTSPLDFQSIILSLQRYWADQGCLVWQPYYTQVGAGTMNPATFLRVLGPEPWRVVYVEPSVRPDDGRYGENPNRMVQHYQLQVILKPDPGNPQEIYLKSLEAIGIDPRQHDIRFVEDNWESPALGAWGLGWEVWLDGQEITQFTYFQQAGGIQLDPVSVEITYGLDRIAMPLQKVRSFTDIRWSPEYTAGDVNLQAEREHSRYYFEVADVDRLHRMYDLFKAEAETALDQGLVLPAHDYILKCSHTFNILDTRGAVGVTERQAMFAGMRDLAHRTAELYLEQRQRLEFPWMEKGKSWSIAAPAAMAQAAAAAAKAAPAEGKSPLLVEIGTEELPAADLATAMEQLKARVPALLDELRLEHGEVRVLGTPRRLVVTAADLAARQPDRASLVKGPPASRAFDSFGAATPAAVGFARSKGVEVSDLQVREIDGGQYVTAEVHEAGRPAVQVLSEALAGLVAGIRFDKSMRWNGAGVYFSRPIRWLLALYGGQAIPFSYAGLDSGKSTRGLRFHQPETIAVGGQEEYFRALASQGVILDTEQRKQTIREQVLACVTKAGGDPVVDEDLLDEVTALVEAPAALRGSFDPSHLELPADVLVSVMKKHQRYFPVRKGDALLPYFVVVRNGDGQYIDVVADGNEQVIRARFADAAFFVREDLKHPLETSLPRLGTLTFQVKLGSMLDKSRRVTHLVEELAPELGLSKAETAAALRAAELCKADLVTHMVVEMTSLQGVMGRYYALHSGQKPDVAQAIFEHYLPRFAGDATPASRAGLLVGLADRLDSLAGLFAAGLAPSGTKDPYAQRRAALGLVQNLIAWDLDFDLRAGLKAAAARLPIPASEESQAACLEFIVGRLRGALMDQGYRYDGIDAVLAAQGNNPASSARAVKELSAWVSRSDWNTILPAYARCVRITRDQTQRYAVNPAVFADPAENALYEALLTAEKASKRPGSAEDFLHSFVPMIPAINQYFEAVLVMAEERKLRENRLGLLQRIAALAAGVADMSVLEGF